MMLLNPRRWLRQLKPTFFTLICIGALILLRNLAYDNSVYQSISLHQKMEYQIFSSFYQKDEGVRRVFRKKVAHLDELGLFSNLQENPPMRKDIVCRHPKLDLFNDANRAAFFDVGSMQCYGRELFSFDNGVLRFNRTALRGDVIKKCSYQAVERIDDNYATYTTPLTRNSSPFDMVLQHDFIRVQCYFEIEYNTEYQRNLLSINSQHGRHLHSINERYAKKIESETGIQNLKLNPNMIQRFQKSKIKKKIVPDSKKSLIPPKVVLKPYSKKSASRRLDHAKFGKSEPVLSPSELKKDSIKLPHGNSGINSFNFLQDPLEKSKAKIPHEPKSPKNMSRVKKISNISQNAIPKIHLHQSNQLPKTNHNVAKKGTFNSKTKPKNSYKSKDILKPLKFGQNLNKGSRRKNMKQPGKLLMAKTNKHSNQTNGKLLGQTRNQQNPFSISNSTNKLKNVVQSNSKEFIKRMNQFQPSKKIPKKTKETIQSSFDGEKQKHLSKKFVKEKTSFKFPLVSQLKKAKLKKTSKLFKNGSHQTDFYESKKIQNDSHLNKSSRIIFREVNYPELNWRQGHYPIKKSDTHLSKEGGLAGDHLGSSSKQKLRLSERGVNQVNASTKRSRIWPFVKPIHKYFKKMPTHLAELPEVKQQNNNNNNSNNNNNLLENENKYLNLKNTSIEVSPIKIPVIARLRLVPKEKSSVKKPLLAATSHYPRNSDDTAPNSKLKPGFNIDSWNIISKTHEDQVPPIHHQRNNQSDDSIRVDQKSSKNKETMNSNDSLFDDSSRENYVNLPPEDYGVTEELPDVEQFFVQIYPKPEVFQRISEVPPFVRINVIPLNILIYGLDSLSHLSFQRKLPLTYKHLRDSLDAVIMNGYNIVGDATTAAIIPLLTGKTETELPEVRKNQLASGFVDDYPLIWNKFRSKGYATLFAEDSPSLAVFNLRFNGFYAAPTDHYMRPFWQAVSESVLHERSLNFCLGSKPKHQFTLDYVMDFFQEYRNVSKFAFAFHGELSHNDNNPVQYLDEDFVHFLQQMQQKNFLNNTLLIVMSDHGARYSNVRNTVQGKLEERLPFMSFVFPTWFHQKYPYFVNNLKNNREKLVTPFDVHETMLDLLDTSRMYEPIEYSSRGISLLQSVPRNRTCKSAGIAMHWCSCLTRFDVNPSTPLVQMSLHKILSYIRTLLLPVKHLCAELSLKKIIYAYLVTPNEKVLKFTSSKDADNRVANFSQKMLLDMVHYQLTFETYPNHGLYEASVQVDIRKEFFQVFPEISRLNKYGEQPSCIKETYPDLRKYCYCKIR